MRTRQLRVGDWVEIRTQAQILKTLDGKGQLDGMPFMPEMFQFCGKRFQIYKRAHKTCDYTSPHFRTRRLQRTVHLETRCDGEAHGGCQAGCLLYWKEAWLRPVDHDSVNVAAQSVTFVGGIDTSPERCSEADVRAGTHVGESNSEPPTYVCQATQVPFATTDLHWWDVSQYVEDYRSGNVTLGRILTGFIYSTYYSLSQAGIGLGPPMRWLYDKLRWIWGGSRWPRTPGVIPAGNPTPTTSLGLQPGELVRVRAHEEILQTVTTANLNRGMHWDAELVPYCGGTYKVLRRLSKIIDERTGKMVEMKSPCIVLDSVVCQARYSDCRMLCPKGMYSYWREIWLERVASGNGDEIRSDGARAAVPDSSR